MNGFERRETEPAFPVSRQNESNGAAAKIASPVKKNDRRFFALRHLPFSMAAAGQHTASRIGPPALSCTRSCYCRNRPVRTRLELTHVWSPSTPLPSVFRTSRGRHDGGFLLADPGRERPAAGRLHRRARSRQKPYRRVYSTAGNRSGRRGRHRPSGGRARRAVHAATARPQTRRIRRFTQDARGQVHRHSSPSPPRTIGTPWRPFGRVKPARTSTSKSPQATISSKAAR